MTMRIRSKPKKLTKSEAMRIARRMAKSYIGAGTPKVKKVRGQNEYEYVFPIKTKRGKLLAYGFGTIQTTLSSGTSISIRHIDMIRGKRRKKTTAKRRKTKKKRRKK